MLFVFIHELCIMCSTPHDYSYNIPKMHASLERIELGEQFNKDKYLHQTTLGHARHVLKVQPQLIELTINTLCVLKPLSRFSSLSTKDHSSLG